MVAAWPTPMRASFIIWNMYSRPRCGAPIRWPIVSPLSPKLSRQLVVPRWPILWFSPARAMLLLSPTAPLSSTRRLGTRNSEMPRVPAGAPAMRASTMWTMFSDIS